MANLIATSDLKTHLQIASATATWDTVLAALATQVSQAIEAYCDREFSDTPGRVEYYDGHGYHVLTPRHHPVISVASIYDDPSRTWDASTLIPTTDYYIDSSHGNRRIVFTNGRVLNPYGLYSGRGSVQLTYRSGYASNVFPPDLVLAACELGAFYFNRRKSAGFASQSSGNQSLTLLKDWPDDVKDLLKKYRNQEYS